MNQTILAAVNDAAPDSAKGFWWDIKDISKLLALRENETEVLLKCREPWLLGAGLDMQTVQPTRGGPRTRFFLMRAGGQPPTSLMRSEEERVKNAKKSAPITTRSGPKTLLLF